MGKFKAISMAIILLVLNIVLDYNFPSTSILLAPLIIAIISVVISKSNLQLSLVVLFTIFIICANDISEKLSLSGSNDDEKQGVINLIFGVIVIISTLIVFSLLASKGRLIYVICICLLIPLTSYFYISYFESLGLVDAKNPSQSKEIAIKNGVFIKDLNFPDDDIIYKNDTIKILSGWLEKQVIIDHRHIIKIYNDSSMVNYTIKLKSNKKLDDLNIYYKVNDTDVNGSNHIDSNIQFSYAKSSKSILLNFFKLCDTIKNSILIKQIKLN